MPSNEPPKRAAPLLVCTEAGVAPPSRAATHLEDGPVHFDAREQLGEARALGVEVEEGGKWADAVRVSREKVC